MYKKLLSNISSYIHLSEEEKIELESLFLFKSIKKNEFFLREGEVANSVGFINSGLFRYYLNEDGEIKTFAFSKENEYISNHESFLTKTPSTKSIQALEDSEILIISREGLKKFYEEFNEGEKFGRKIMEGLFIYYLQELTSFYSHSPEQRYLKILEQQPELIQRISQYHIASYLGIKPQSLSRIRSRLA